MKEVNINDYRELFLSRRSLKLLAGSPAATLTVKTKFLEISKSNPKLTHKLEIPPITHFDQIN